MGTYWVTVFLLHLLSLCCDGSPAGCFNHGECLGGNIVGSVSGVTTLGDCLQECQSSANCEVVTFYPGWFNILWALSWHWLKQIIFSIWKMHVVQSMSDTWSGTGVPSGRQWMPECRQDLPSLWPSRDLWWHCHWNWLCELQGGMSPALQKHASKFKWLLLLR